MEGVLMDSHPAELSDNTFHKHTILLNYCFKGQKKSTFWCNVSIYAKNDQKINKCQLNVLFLQLQLMIGHFDVMWEIHCGLFR
jgi:hypothetical protein